MAQKKTEFGFSFLELLIAIGLLSTATMAIMSMNVSLSTKQADLNSLFQIDSVRQNIQVLVRNQSSWVKTTHMSLNASPGGMGCLNDGTPCTENGSASGTPITNRRFAIYDPAGTLIFDATNTANGFTFDGTPCSSFSQSGNDECPFRFELTWSAQCTSGSCVNPVVKVTGALVFRPEKARFPLKPSRYSVVDILRNAQ